MSYVALAGFLEQSGGRLCHEGIGRGIEGICDALESDSAWLDLAPFERGDEHRIAAASPSELGA